MEKLSWRDILRPYAEKAKEKSLQLITTPRSLICSLILLIFFFIAIFTNTFTAEKEPSTSYFFTEGTLLRYKDPAWEKENLAADQILNDFTLAPAGEVTIVGNKGLVIELQASGDPTSRHISEIDLYTVDIKNELGFIAGQKGTIFYLADDEWISMESPTDQTIFQIKIFDSSHALAVGKSGTLLEYDGESWNPVETPTLNDLYGIAFLSEREAIAVGQKGTILHIDEEEITVATVNCDETLTSSLLAISVILPDKIMVVGEEGIILSYEEGVWQPMSSPEFGTLNTIILTDHDHGYIGGEEGIFLVYEDSLWQHTHIDFLGPINRIKVANKELVALSGQPYLKQLVPPSPNHYLGTDLQGRDLYVRFIHAFKDSMLTASLVATILVAGLFIFALLFGSKLPLHKLFLFYVLPPLFVGIIVSLKTSQYLPVIVLSVLPPAAIRLYPKLFKLSQEYKDLPWRNHLSAFNTDRWLLQPLLAIAYFLKAIVPVFINALAWALTIESGLSFLGFHPPSLLSWGTMLCDAYWSNNWFGAWWWFVPPGLAITLVLVAIYLLTEHKGERYYASGN